MDQTTPRINAPSHHAKKPRRPRAPPSPAVPEPPAMLSPAAAAEWRRVCPRLLALGMQLDLDLQVFLAYCCATGDLADVRAKWQGDGAPATVQRPSGAREHPVIATMRTLGADILKYGHQLGLTPRSRKVLGVELGAMPADPARDSAESAEDRRIAATYFNH